MPAILTRTTARGLIELAVSDRAAAHAGVARDPNWGRDHRAPEADPLAAWRERLRRMDDAERKREKRRRLREAPLTDTGGSAAAVAEAFPLEPDEVAIEARRGRRPVKAGAAKKPDPPPCPNAGRWFLGCLRERWKREVGQPGYGTAPATR